jgi:hypothetical protein
MKLDFNFPVIGLDGRPIEDQFGRPINAGKILANTLVMQPEGEIAKLFDWAIAMHRGEQINLDKADQKKLRDFIEKSQQMAILIKKHLLDVLDGNKQQENNNGIPIEEKEEII